MISVIVPVYNAEKYLHRCVDSILTQTFDNFELLLINDGSNDNSGVICDEYALKDSRVRVFHKENGGVSSARNLGLDNSKGEWIAFCDADDYALPTFLSTYDELINIHNADLCILDFIADYSISTDEIIYKSSFDYYGDAKSALLLLNNNQMIGVLWNKLFRKSIIKDNSIRLNELFKFREDEDFLLKYLCYANNVAITSRQCYIYIVPDWNKYSNSVNLPTIISMYMSVLDIYKGKANCVTDSYQIELFNEWLSFLRVDRFKSIKMLPMILRIAGWRIFRFVPFKAACNKIYKFFFS